MTKHVKAVTPKASTDSATDPAAAGHSRGEGATDPESLDQLRGDCARMAPRWKAGEHETPPPGRASDLHGVKVPDESAALVDGMSDYGD
ncbi:hypothetical protein [Streptomyces halobius]|uniref:Uncharacterized protein n=1 Tax=Streptomyces halobius TaxID=2879846 RepID=A0ABY4MEV2_9ACTN|nr:hypothetical protein [Streptomyces halobius]UQA95932.1 hypothetical protein K9S39_32295 [Streptomyces halobius]